MKNLMVVAGIFGMSLGTFAAPTVKNDNSIVKFDKGKHKKKGHKKSKHRKCEAYKG
jgi:hypothetical protein